MKRVRVAAHVLHGCAVGLIATTAVAYGLTGNTDALVASVAAAGGWLAAWMADVREARARARARVRVTEARKEVAAARADVEALAPAAVSVAFVGGALDGAELSLPSCPCGTPHAPRGVLSDVGVYEPDGVARTTYRMKHTTGGQS